MLRLIVILLLSCCASEALAGRTIEKDETWSGKVVVAEMVTVASNAVLTVNPGTEVIFAGSAALTVQGRILAKGTKEQPISFHAEASDAAGSWQGISFMEAREGSELEHVLIEGAVNGLSIITSKVSIVSSTIKSGVKGIDMGAEAIVVADGLDVNNMSETGIEANTHSQGMISNCRIDSVAGAAILTGKQTRFVIRGNRISNAKIGVLTSGDSPPIENNSIAGCEIGIAISHANPQAVIRGNSISGARKGISCRQFASPTIEQNTITDCDEGIDCFRGSSPLIRQNRLEGNRRALSAIQMCNPQVLRNDLIKNDMAVYLHLSSYANFHENNFVGNQQHIVLDNMSYDWEERASKKPSRNLQMQNDFLVKQGRAMPTSIKVEVKSEGFVNARGNFWGAETTKEMIAKGEDAEISTIVDGHDLPILTYDGWPGEYKKDRVKYAGWHTERIAGTGP